MDRRGGGAVSHHDDDGPRLLPWKDTYAPEDFDRVTRNLRFNAQASWTIAKDTDDGDRDVIIRAVYGRVVVTLGNGSLQRLDVVPPGSDAVAMFGQMVAGLIELEGWEQIDGSDVPDLLPETRKDYAEAQAMRAQMEEEQRKVMAQLEDPAFLRDLGKQMLSKARDMEGAVSAPQSALDGPDDRIGMYV